MSIITIVVCILLSTFCQLSQAQSQDFDPVLASTIASYTITAYCNQNHIANWKCGITCREHPEIVEVQMLWNKTGGNAGYVAYNTVLKSIVVVFRGTLPWFFGNDKEDIDILFTSYLLCNNDCKVGKGFYLGWLDIRDQFWNFFMEKQRMYPQASVIVSGHSLGASLSLHCAAELAYHGIQNLIFYNFGQPRVGDHNFASWFNSTFQGTQYRVVHYKDPAPQWPDMTLGYWHTPREVYYNKDQSSYKVCNLSGEDPTCQDGNKLDLNALDHLDYMQYNYVGLISMCLL